MVPRGTPAIACVGLIGRLDQPLSVTLFPVAPTFPPRKETDYHWHLLSSLDIFHARSSDPLTGPPADGDFGLLFAIDERLAVYGFISPTGIRFVVIVDMQGKSLGNRESFEGGRAQAWNSNSANGFGVKDSDLRPVFRALHRAYVGLLRNPFFDPDECDPGHVDVIGGMKKGRIESKWFEESVRRIGEGWFPGVGVL